MGRKLPERTQRHRRSGNSGGGRALARDSPDGPCSGKDQRPIVWNAFFLFGIFGRPTLKNEALLCSICVIDAATYRLARNATINPHHPSKQCGCS